MSRTKTRLNFNEDGTLDEIVAERATVHLEQMDRGVYWLCIETDGKEHIIWLHSKGHIKAKHHIDG